VEQSKYVQEPENDDNHHNGIQDGFDAARHGDEAVYEPKQNADYDQNED
jgi:hypothetical protein